MNKTILSNKKILIIAPRIASISETFIYDQITGIKKFELIVCCNQRQNEGIFVFEKEPVVLGTMPAGIYDRAISKMHRFLSGRKKYSLHFSAEKKITSILRNEKIALIHCHYGETAISLLPILKKIKIPIIVTFHGYDASKMLLDETYCRQLSELFSRNTYSITVSKDMELRLSKFNLNVKKNSVIPCGIDGNYFKPQKKYYNSAPLVLLHSGRVTPKKGVLDLVRVINEIKTFNILLWIIGDGGLNDKDEYEKLKSFITEQDLKEKVELYGAQPREKVKEIMQKADIFILNSRIASDGDMEGLPVSILEAMACGLPVISTRHSGIPEIIEDGVHGLLVPEFDNVGLKDAILTLINKPDLRETLSRNALIRSEDFSKEITISKIEDFYQTILEQNVKEAFDS